MRSAGSLLKARECGLDSDVRYFATFRTPTLCAELLVAIIPDDRAVGCFPKVTRRG